MHKIKQMIKYIATLLLTVLFVACNNGKGQQPSEENEDPKAKEILQGIWLDDETETPLMRIIGDTIYYSDAQSAPVYFKILGAFVFFFASSKAAAISSFFVTRIPFAL